MIFLFKIVMFIYKNKIVDFIIIIIFVVKLNIGVKN